MKKSLPVFFIVALGISTIWVPHTAWAQKKYILLGASNTSSSQYTYAVAATKVINQYVPEINGSVVETGASVDNVKRLRAGQIDIGAVMTDMVMYEAWKGIGMWKDMPAPDIRMLWVYTQSIFFNVVREDSGVEKLEDLEGKKFNPGMRGSSTEVMTKKIFEILGIRPNYYVGGTADVVGAIKDNRVVGFVKVGAGFQLDAASLDLMTLTKIRLISMTPEQVKKVKAGIPYLPFFTVPAGKIKAMPNLPEYINFGTVVGTVALKSFPEDLAYKAVKAILRGRDTIVAAYPAFKDVDVLRDTVELSMIPLHAGAYRAFKELGVKIPERAVPPEIKP